MVLFLNNEEIEQVLDTPSFIQCLEEVYRELAHGGAVNQPRGDTRAPLEGFEDGRYSIKTQVGIVPGLNIGALRFISVAHSYPTLYGKKRDIAMPLAGGNGFVGLIVLFDINTTEPVAILNDGYIRDFRVACTAAIAAKHFARPDSDTLAIIGSGQMARAHAEAFFAVKKFSRLRVYSPDAGHRSNFARDMSPKLGVPVEAVDDPEKAVRGADIVAACTSSEEPVILGKWLDKGMFCTMVRGCEVDREAVERADLIPLGSGEVYKIHLMGEGPFGRIHEGGTRDNFTPWVNRKMDSEASPALWDVVAGKVPGRRSPDEIGLYIVGGGLGMLFAAPAAKAYQLAKEAGLGRDVPSEWFIQQRRTG